MLDVMRRSGDVHQAGLEETFDVVEERLRVDLEHGRQLDLRRALVSLSGEVLDDDKERGRDLGGVDCRPEDDGLLDSLRHRHADALSGRPVERVVGGIESAVVLREPQLRHVSEEAPDVVLVVVVDGQG